MREILFAINFSFVLCELKTETTAADGAETESWKQWARERKYLGKIIQISWLWVCIEGKTMKQSPKLIKIYANTKRASERERQREWEKLWTCWASFWKRRRWESSNIQIIEANIMVKKREDDMWNLDEYQQTDFCIRTWEETWDCSLQWKEKKAGGGWSSL